MKWMKDPSCNIKTADYCTDMYILCHWEYQKNDIRLCLKMLDLDVSRRTGTCSEIITTK